MSGRWSHTEGKAYSKYFVKVQKTKEKSPQIKNTVLSVSNTESRKIKTTKYTLGSAPKLSRKATCISF